jgi:hypothetical protein
MRKSLLLALAIAGLVICAKAQSAQNLILYPSPVTMNSILNVQYDLYNNTPAPITGVVHTSAKINGVYKGVINNYMLTAPVLPGQTTQINFSIPVTYTDFNPIGNNIVIIWPSESINEDGSATATVYVMPQN